MREGVRFGSYFVSDHGRIPKCGYLLNSVYQFSIGDLYQFTSGSDKSLCATSFEATNRFQNLMLRLVHSGYCLMLTESLL
ncbi:hypothetical protein C8R32_101236 [Nitrosospira sp. Nsp5]|uniref:Uncharacterized protein n=1 Tax=Nitrosospira multiformis TaxID=1231 RepID=A0ABY0TFY3_9PROT|nr:hypothetical protein C8R32_101236 [Nitrosospira sp. Nsp5]SDQ77203.1 hypothetical protein SAMN05216402_2224 [Nitrosospira multiformis]